MLCRSLKSMLFGLFFALVFAASSQANSQANLANEYSMSEPVWESGVSFLLYLQKNAIPMKLYHELDSQDQELAAEIHEGVRFYELRDATGAIAQVLIPISEELQIHIYKDAAGSYALKFSPAIVSKIQTKLVIDIKRSMYQDVAAAANARLASVVQKAFPSIDYRRMQPGDRVIVRYSQKSRLGRPYGDPQMQSAMVQVNKSPNYVFNYKDDYYDEAGRQIRTYAFILPVGNARISSPFNPGRFHPILKKYRAHLGIDYAVPTGTPIRAAAGGRVIFRGVKGGYGNVLQIDHGNGYMTLYAHQSRFGTYGVGARVNQGAVIGYVGSTGMSTGPHLHFGMYRNNVAINPAGVVKVVKSALAAGDKKAFGQLVAREKAALSELAAGELFAQTPFIKGPNVVELK